MSGFYEKRLGYKAPDLSAPRYRSCRMNVLSQATYKAYCKAFPQSTVSYADFRRIVLAFNTRVRRLVIDSRDGVELPEQLGALFIGSCPRKKDNPNPQLSQEHDQKIHFKNWESNQYLCKIFYTHHGTKYRFAQSRHWYFKPCRVFKREVSEAYRQHWNRYRKISPFKKINKLYTEGIHSIKVQKHDYHNRGVDFSDTQPN